MPLLSGGLTARIFHVVGDVPDGFRTSFEEAISAHLFRPPASAVHVGEVMGWCDPENHLHVTEPETWDWVHTPYLRLALRIDVKKIPSKLLKARLARDVAAWCAEHARTRAPRSITEELREVIREELLRRTLPKTKIVEIVWDTAQRRILVDTLSDPTCDLVRRLLTRTFGIKLVAFNPLSVLPTVQATRLGLVPPARIHGSNVSDLSECGSVDGQMDLWDLPDFTLYPEWLVWIWWRSDHGPLLLEHEAGEVWIGDKLVLADEGDTKVVVTGAGASSARAAHAALVTGKLPREAQIVLRASDREYTLNLRDAALSLSASKLPAALGDSPGDVLQERMLLFDEAFDHLLNLVERYAKARLAPAWPDDLHAMRLWAAEIAAPLSS